MTQATRKIPKMNIHRLLAPTRAPAQKLPYRKERELKRKGEWDPEKENRKLTTSEKREWYQSRLRTIESHLLREKENYDKTFKEAVEAISRAKPIERNNPTSRTYKNIYGLLRRSAIQTLKLTRMELFRAMLLMNKELNWKNPADTVTVRKQYKHLIQRMIREEEELVKVLNNKQKFDKEVIMLMRMGGAGTPPWTPPQGA